jgi:hypothetical protein
MEVPFLPARSSLAVFTAQERPDLWERSRSLFQGVWPEYNNHGNHTPTLFRDLVTDHAPLQVLLYDGALDALVARGRAIAFGWDGSLEDLPAGMDGLSWRVAESPGPFTAVSALAAEVSVDQQGRGLSRLVLEAMAEATRRAGLAPLVAPVRPRSKDLYPLTPIDRYARWTRPDGLPFDPWLRVHARMGATMLRPEPRSLQIEAPVAEWERWTEMAFPEDGDYVFPGGLAPLEVRRGTGCYFEPNVWMLHDI